MDQPIYLLYAWHHVNGDSGVTLGKFNSFADAVQLMFKWNNNHTIWKYYFVFDEEWDDEIDHTKEYLARKPLEYFQEIPNAKN